MQATPGYIRGDWHPVPGQDNDNIKKGRKDVHQAELHVVTVQHAFIKAYIKYHLCIWVK